jgi:alpha-beta hydrolase superfamily lysophospholipase
MKRTGMLAVAVLLAAGLAAMALLFQPAQAKAAAGNGKSAGGRGIVYLLRGGGDIFSTGMDTLAEELRAKGVNARSLSYTSWRDVAREAKERRGKTRQPIILLGHSFGANADVLIADDLALSNTPVALIILFDPTDDLKVPANVRHLINFFSSSAVGMDLKVEPGLHFSGKLENVAQLDVGHLDIDEDARLHKRAIAEIVKVVGASTAAIAGQ